GITLASLALGWVGEPAAAGLFERLFDELPLMPPQWVGAASHTAALVVGFGLITVLHIILGELVPKSLALQRTEAIALFVVRPMRLFLSTFRPLIMLIRWGGNFVVRLFGIQPASSHRSAYTVEELRLVVSASHEAGEVAQVSQELVEAAFSFPELTAGQIMVP